MGPGAAALLAALLVGVTVGQPAVVGAEPDVGASAPAVRQLPPQTGGGKVRQRPEMDQGSLLVRFSPRSGTAAAALADHGLERRRAVGRAGFVEVGTGGRSPDAVRKELARDPRVETVEPNYVRRAMADPNDALFAQQWSLAAARFPQAWERQSDARDVTVAVLDSGVDLDHPDLSGNLVPGWDAVENDSVPQDEAGHGTMVAGIIAASAGNGRGIAGGAYRARLQPVRVLNASAAGTDADIVEGITWAADHAAGVINLSLGGPQPGAALASAVAYAQKKGAVVVAASGNSGGPEPVYPAAFPGVVGVTAVDTASRLTWFSSHGSWIDMAASGVDVVSTYLEAGPADAYARGSGSSFSAPLVAAAAALLRQAHPQWTGAEVGARLTSTARDAGPPGHDDGYGFGLLDAAAALGDPRLDPLPSEPEDAYEPNPVPERATPFSGAVTATIAPEQDVDWFAFEVASPRWLEVAVTPPSGSASQGMDPVVNVYGPEGGEVGWVDAAGMGQAERLIFEARAPGRHLVRIASYNASISAGEYTVDIASASAPPPSFSSISAYRTGSWPESTAMGDFTGDGRGDVVMTTSFYDDGEQNDYSVFVFAQLPDGSLGPPTRHRTTGAGTMAAASGDVDGDGDADVAVATSSGVEVLLQAGGALGAPQVVPFTAPASQVEIADVDNDRVADLVVVGSGGVAARTRTANGWAPPRSLTADSGSELEVGDVSGDGRADLVLIRSECPSTTTCTAGVSSYVQRAGGGFAKTHHPTVHGSSPAVNGMAVGDLNGDGRDDIAVTIGGDAPSSRINTFLQQADGTLGPAQVKAVHSVPQPIEAGDVNADGRVDLVTVHPGQYAIGTIPQQPDGTLGDEIVNYAPNASGYHLKGLSLGDADGRLGAEAALADHNHGLLVFRQAGSNATNERPWVNGTTPLDRASGVPTRGEMTVTFGRAVDPSSLTPSTVALLDGSTLAPVTASRSYDAGARRLTLVPSQALAPGSSYQLVLAGVRDARGAQMRSREVVRFRTATADPPPTTTTTTTTAPTTTSTTAPPTTTTSTTTPPTTTTSTTTTTTTAPPTTTTSTTTTTAPPTTTTTAPPTTTTTTTAPPTTTATATTSPPPATATTSPPPAPASAEAQAPAPSSASSAVPASDRAGYWMVGAAGAVYAFGEAAHIGNAPVPPGQTVTNVAVTPSGNGYWLVTAAGAVYAFGDAAYLGGSPSRRPGETVTSISPHPGGGGYWLFTNQGRAIAYGTARHFGDVGALRLNGPVLGSVATPSGDGYYMVATDGGIFAFGDARFRGSMGGRPLNGPVVGLAPDPDGSGYWLVASDGGIFAFDSGFRGSMGGSRLNRPVTGMVAYGDGYLMVASDGGIFSFSAKPFVGSLGATPPPTPIVGVAALNR
ncbi:MAG TPA: S8 family serine peptidase [Acidimicrobiales bacterium]|nr:S8 family serine peptidase [Acidimicrobiales bacterium]